MEAWHQEILSRKFSKPQSQWIPANAASKGGHFPNCSEAMGRGRGSVGPRPDLESPEAELLLSDRSRGEASPGPSPGTAWDHSREAGWLEAREVNAAWACLGERPLPLTPWEHWRPWPWPSSCGLRGECRGGALPGSPRCSSQALGDRGRPSCSPLLPRSKVRRLELSQNPSARPRRFLEVFFKEPSSFCSLPSGADEDAEAQRGEVTFPGPHRSVASGQDQVSWGPGRAHCFAWLFSFCSNRIAESGFFLFTQGLAQMPEAFSDSPLVALGPPARFPFSAQSLNCLQDILHSLICFCLPGTPIRSRLRDSICPLVTAVSPACTTFELENVPGPGAVTAQMRKDEDQGG